MKKKVFLALLVMALLVVAFTVVVSAKDVDIGITDVNGNAIVLPTEDADGDALTWYRVTEAPTDGTYYEYLSGTTTYYLVSVKTKDAAYVNDNYYLCYSYTGIKTGAWSGNLVVINMEGITHADGSGPQKLGFVFEGTPIAYVYFSASITEFVGWSGNTDKSLFYAASSLVEVDVESGSKIESINTYAFYNCKKLKQMILPENLKTIAYDAFNGLTIEITVPKSVTTFEESRWANFTVHYTGTAEDHAGWTYQPTNIDYVSHCDVYRNGVHTEGEVVDYITYCSECGEKMYCENPAHNLVTSISYESYAQNGVKSVLCTECGLDAKETSVAAIITFKGYSKNSEGTSLCVGYTIDQTALAELKSYNPELTTFEYGLAIAIEGTVQDNKLLAVDENGVSVANKSVIMVKLGSTDYTKVEMKLTGDFSNNQNTGILMSAYVYDGEKLVYIQGDENNNSIEMDSVNAITMAQLSE